MTIKWIPENQTGEQQSNGLVTRAASYGASMINAYFFDQMLRHDGEYKVASDMTRIVAIENELLPALKELGFFRLFNVTEWLRTEHHGRLLIALLYLRRNPEELTPEIKFQLKSSNIARLKALMEATISHSRYTNQGGIVVDPSNLIAEGQQGWITNSGIFYPKGTSVASMDNVAQYQAAIDEGVSDVSDQRIQNAVNDQRFITNMMAYGIFFSFFPPEDWLQNETYEGRMMPALLLLQQFPERMSATLASRLADARSRVSQPTRSLLEETLIAYESCIARKQEVMKVLEHELRTYVDFLNHCNIRKVEQSWLDSEDTTLLSSFAPGFKRGRRAIVEYLQEAECKLEIDESSRAITVEWQRGLAQVIVSGRRNAHKGEPPRARIKLTSQWRRTDTPSCSQVINRATDDWQTGQWRIFSWSECAEIIT